MGDIMVVIDAAASLSSWPLSKVLEVFPNKKGHVFSVRLQTTSNKIKSP